MFLDISEADLVYTETLMQRGKENYEGKEIVILGKCTLYHNSVWMANVIFIQIDATVDGSIKS